jgi:hypothetical protein
MATLAIVQPITASAQSVSMSGHGSCRQMELGAPPRTPTQIPKNAP